MKRQIHPNILIIGGVTIDTLHLPGRRDPIRAPGGAGLYTALAAAAAGGRVRLFAQVPEPMPDLLEPIMRRLDWVGPRIPLERLPQLEIVHHGGGEAELRSANWGAQLDLSPSELPEDLSPYRIAHIAPLGPAGNQLKMTAACRARGVEKIAAGTYGHVVYDERDRVQALLERCDYFFMNENEANGLFGSPDSAQAVSGQVVFVTRGERGAFAFVESGDRISVESPAVTEVDPTGAGDTFCGAVLARLLQGDDLEAAMHKGTGLAAEMIQGLGPERLHAR